MKPGTVYVPPAVAEACIAEFGALPEGVEVVEKIPDAPRPQIVIVGEPTGRGGMYARLAAQLRDAGHRVVIVDDMSEVTAADFPALTNAEAVAAMLRGTVQSVGRQGYASAAGMFEALPRKPKREAQWKSERRGMGRP